MIKLFSLLSESNRHETGGFSSHFKGYLVAKVFARTLICYNLFGWKDSDQLVNS